MKIFIPSFPRSILVGNSKGMFTRPLPFNWTAAPNSPPRCCCSAPLHYPNKPATFGRPRLPPHFLSLILILLVEFITFEAKIVIPVVFFFNKDPVYKDVRLKNCQ